MLDARLGRIADLVREGVLAVDVGTDHALLVAELVKSRKCPRAFACDIKEGPLEAARTTVEKYGITDKVELVLSDGLDDVTLPENVHDIDIIIAGMGGDNIVHILSNFSGRIRGGLRFVLQPMSKPEVLRLWLRDNYMNWEEFAVEDGDKIYLIFTAGLGDMSHTKKGQKLSEFGSIVGNLYPHGEAEYRYLANKAEKLEKVSRELQLAGKLHESAHYHSLSVKVKDFSEWKYREVPVWKIYELLDSVYPFDTQEPWDNSGYLVRQNGSVSKVLLSLDIDRNTALEAVERLRGVGDDRSVLVISHHPVIFSPLKYIDADSPVGIMMKNNIEAICMHTNVDKSALGTNGVIVIRLSESLALMDSIEEFADGIGCVVVLAEEEKISVIAEKVKGIFGCEYVRASRAAADYPDKTAKRIAVCSGSGGSMLGDALSKNCDLYITGDIKHDVWIDAANQGIALLDCGHFHTENLVLEQIRYVLEKEFPQLDVEIADSSVDPCVYF